MSGAVSLAVVASVAIWGAAAFGVQGSAVIQTGTVTRDVDGDTLLVQIDGGEEAYVRLIGIDTPEDVKPGSPVQCGALKASAVMSRLAGGRRVRLESDPTQDRFDRYGRTLAYVYLQGHRETLEETMLRKGLAEIYIYHGNPFLKARRYEQLEDRAKAADRGTWNACDGDFHRDE